MILRPLLINDLRGVSRMISVTNDGVDPDALAEDLRECHVRWPTLQVGAFDEDGRLQGAIDGRLDRNDPSTGWSDDIVVDPSMRGSGLGGKLLVAQLEAFRLLGCKRVRGRSPRRLWPAVPFFEHHGFKVIEKTVAQGIWGITDGEPLWITERVF